MARIAIIAVLLTCYLYPVKLTNVQCFLGRCSSVEDVSVGGMGVNSVTKKVTGYKLRNGMTRYVEICR